MKLKELCERTGLSRKTIRLYEEKELFTPKKEVRNGREYRDYSEEDVQTLLVVASLRKAWFTMEEIRRMQQDPAAIGEILPQYQQWLRLQKRQLEGLLSAVEKLDLEEIGDVETLSAKFEKETNKLPLPATDQNPHFKYLDELEKEERTMKTVNDQEQKKKAFRQTALVMDRDRVNDHAITFGAIRECEELEWSESGPVKKEDNTPLWVRVLSTVSGWGIVVSLVVMCAMQLQGILGVSSYYETETPPYLFWARVVFVAFVVLYGGLRGLIAYWDRQRWLKVVREQEAEKAQKK